MESVRTWIQSSMKYKNIKGYDKETGIFIWNKEGLGFKAV